MLSPGCLKKILAAGVLLLFALPVFAQDVIDNDVHAVLLLNKAKSKHQAQSGGMNMPGPGNHAAQLRSYRKSKAAAHHETGGSGVSIGNIYPAQGTNRPHSTTVVIQGHVINSGK